MLFPRLRRTRPPSDTRAVPLVLGVTGHRDLREVDVPRIRQAVGVILTQVARRSRHTPLVLLSALAQGADQLCATVALEHGLQVWAPLPFPAAIYRASSSFDTEAARHQLDVLLDDPRVTAFVAPLPPAEMPTDEAAWWRLSATRDTRHRCYANAGGYVVLHCQALMALWDGVASEAPAGTAQMVQFKRTGRPPEVYPWTQPLFHWGDRGPVYVVHTPRATTPTAHHAVAGRRTLLYPHAPHSAALPQASTDTEATEPQPARQQFTALCRSLNRFNRGLRAHPAPSADTTVAELLGTDAPSVPEGLSRLALLRQAAGAQARRAADLMRSLTIAVFGLIGLAALTFHLYAHLFTMVGDHARHQPFTLWVSLVLLLAAFGVVKGVHCCSLEPQALDARALAEALRVQIYWLAAGLNDAVSSSYLQQMHSELSWIRQAVQACSLGLPAGGTVFTQLTPGEQDAQLRRVGQYWLAGQRGYYQRRHGDNHRAATRWRRWGLGLAGVGWALLLWLALTGVSRSEQTAPAPAAAHHVAADGPQGWSARQPPHWLLILSGTLVVAGGLSIAYSERRAFEELARHYHRMAGLFAHSVEALHICIERRDVPAAQDVLRDMGREALTEHASWLLLRRARPFDVPVH